MSDLIGTTATDLAKVGIASAVASVAATAALTTVAAGPIVVAIAVGVATAFGLDALDKRLGVTDALVDALDKAYDSTFGEFSRQLNQVERRLNWQIMNGAPVGQGIFY
jgi:parvulin-like peptidyl-prolyl isomerase